MTKIPLRDFFKNPEKTNFKLSPNGEYFSYLAPFENRLNVYVQKVGSDEPKRLTSVSDRDIPVAWWANNDTVLFLQDNGGDENHHLYSVSIDGGEAKDLTPYENVKASVVDSLIDDDDHQLINLNKRNPQLFDVYKVNVNNGDLELVAENPGGVIGWLADHDGVVRIGVQTDGVNYKLLHRVNAEEEFKLLISHDFKIQISPVKFTADNQRAYTVSNKGRDKAALVLLNLEDATETEELFVHEEVDISNMSWSKKDKKPLGVSYITDKVHFHFFDEERATIYKKLQAKLGDIEIYLTSSNKAEDQFIVRTYSDRSRGAYYFYDVAKDELSDLADVSPWLKVEELCEQKSLSYTSRDGLKINAYLTLPKGVEAKNLPLVVNPHGGPWARDVWGFNPEVQFLANRGYAVLQMNFRGSTGFGRKFWEASFKEWGLKMQDDISDGVQYMIDQGIADPKRIAIYGGSYGGYATLAGVAFTPDLYACAIDYVGVSNLFTFLNTIPPYWKPMLDMMYAMVGHPENDKELLERTSPVYHVDKIKAPLMVVQGAKDPRVNIDESDQIVEALRNRGVEVQYIVKENEGHGFANEENKFEFYTEMEKFFAKHLN